jgi:hypothetical protein
MPGYLIDGKTTATRQDVVGIRYLAVPADKCWILVR